MDTVPARQLLTPLRPSMTDFFYADYNMNLYRGCCHCFIYCDSRSMCYRLTEFDRVRVKADALTLLEKKLRAKRRPGIVTMGAMSDPYNPHEATQKVTQGALTLFRRYGFGASFTTKAALCARDAELLAALSRSAPVRACITLTCADDGLCRKIEPNVSPTSQRLEALRTLSEAGVYAGIWLNPVLPYLTDDWENLESLLVRTREAGGRYAVCFFGMTLRSGNREYYFKALDRDFPGVKEAYLRRFGNQYECPAREAETLARRYRALCQQLGLAWSFPQINREMFARQPSQLSWLDTL